VREKGAYIRYVGHDVRDVPGAGRFQHGTVAFVPRALALELLAGEDFEAAGDPTPATRIIFRVGQKPSAPAQEGERHGNRPEDLDCDRRAGGGGAADAR
jgi:hypothetical protein